MKFLNAILSLALLFELPLALAATESKQCSATAYFHKKVAYDSGIYFRHGQTYHEGIYGSFWDGVNETATKNIGLKRFTYGYDKDMVGYIWGNALEYGYVGGGKGFLLGLQAAVGSLAGLLTPATEAAFDASYAGDTSKSWNQSSVYPVIGSPNGASAATAMQTVLNRTAVEQALVGVSEDNNDDKPDLAGALSAVAAVEEATSAKQTRAVSRDAEWLKRGEEAQEEGCEEDESTKGNDEDVDEDCDEEAEEKDGIKYGPETSAVYRAPWKTAKPVYFHGRCDNCDAKTGFNKNGHGSFQACSLIYHGKEYFGKPDETDDRYTCIVQFDC